MRKLICVMLLAATPALAANKAEDNKVLTAAGMIVRGGQVLNGCEMPANATVTYKDYNGDGKLDALVEDGSAGCYGASGAFFSVLTQDKAGKWKSLIGLQGMPVFKPSKNLGWPDIDIGGPGFCFPTWRYNGKEYDLHKKCPM